MKKNTGYQEMLQDRCPKVVSLALKFCKAKEKWLDHVYNQQIWVLCSNKERLEQARSIVKNWKTNFDFHDTIMWGNLSSSETVYWEKVENMVDFFRFQHIPIESAYNHYKHLGKSTAEIKLEIMKRFLTCFCPTIYDTEEERQRKSNYVNNLTDYLIDSFEGDIQ